MAKQSKRADFLIGVRLAADLIEDALVLTDDDAEIEARLRGRGVVQANFVLQYLNQLADAPEKREGFAAALSGHLAACGNGGYLPDNLRALKFEDYTGRPTTRYLAEDDEEAAQRDPALQALIRRVEEDAHLARG